MAACVTAEAEIDLKPYQLADLLRAELNLPECDETGERLLKPKEILVLANELLGRSALDGNASVKDELRATRAAVRDLPSDFWYKGTETTNDELLTRILAKPATAGGFSTAIACRCLKPNVIDSKKIESRGARDIDGFTVLRGAGMFCSIESEMGNIGKLFRSGRDAEKIGDTTFRVRDRSQPSPGQVVMTAKAIKCESRFIALLTPRWCLLGLFRFAGTESEAATLQLFEELRLEVTAK